MLQHHTKKGSLRNKGLNFFVYRLITGAVNHIFQKSRTMMKYPPVWQMLVVFASGEDKAWLDKVMDAMAEVAKHMDLMVIGPSEAGFGKINDQYRKVIYIKNKDYETLVKAKNRLEQWIDLNKIRKNLLVNFDFNPMNSY